MNNTDCSEFIQILRQTTIFSNMYEKDLELLCHEIDPFYENFKKGSIILSQGELSQCIDVLVEGRVSVKRSIMDVLGHSICIHNPFEIINLETVTSTSKESSFTIEARKDCKILRLEYKKLVANEHIPHRIIRNVLDNVTINLASEMVKFMCKSDILSKRKVRDRIIIFLSTFEKKAGEELFDIGMTQEELAGYLGVDRTSLSETLNELKREGLVEFKKSLFKANLYSHK